MTKPLPSHPTFVIARTSKSPDQQCGSPACAGEFFCYFHTRGNQRRAQRVDMRLDSMALLEDCEAIQFSIMQ